MAIQVPYLVGIATASCGIYSKSRHGFFPMLPILKEIPLTSALQQGEVEAFFQTAL